MVFLETVPFHPHDCLTATWFKSMLVLYKLNGGLGVFLLFYFVKNDKDIKKKSVQTLKKRKKEKKNNL